MKYELTIRESVDSVVGMAQTQSKYMYYLSKSSATSPQIHYKLIFKRPAFLFECLYDQQDKTHVNT